MEDCSESRRKESEMEDCSERRRKDSEVLTDIVDDPFESPMQVDTEVYSLLDILSEIWISTKSAVQNLTSTLGFVQSYMINQQNVDSTARRMQEARKMKGMLVQALNVWQKLYALKRPTCSKEEFDNFLRAQKLYATFTEDIMMHDTYSEWLHEFKDRIKSRSLLGERKVSLSEYFKDRTTSQSSLLGKRKISLPEYVETKSDGGGGGLAALFDLPSTSHQNIDLIPQYISKPENGRLYTMRSPGEKGCQLIRLDVFDFKDIRDKEKRQWWKYAKVRSQFLTSSFADLKHHLLQQLLDQAADDLKEVSGVRREIGDIAFQNI